MQQDNGEVTPVLITLPAVLNVFAAREFVASLKECRGKPLELDASAVEQVGAQCLQALISANLTWINDEVLFSIPRASPAFFDALALAGVRTEEIATEPTSA